MSTIVTSSNRITEALIRAATTEQDTREKAIVQLQTYCSSIKGMHHKASKEIIPEMTAVTFLDSDITAEWVENQLFGHGPRFYSAVQKAVDLLHTDHDLNTILEILSI